MRTITQSVDVACTPERLFQTLVTPTEICLWWNARTAVVVPQLNGRWVATWGKDEDRPDYITVARLTAFEPPRRLVLAEFEYWAGDATLPFAGEMSTEFAIEPAPAGARLTVRQAGFPDGPEADAYYRGCCQGWERTLEAIRDFF